MAVPIPPISFTDAGVLASQASSDPIFSTEFQTGPFAVGRDASATGAPEGVSFNNVLLLIAGGAVAGFFLMRGKK